MGERRYSEKETSRIIQRAAAMQAGSLSDNPEGASLLQIQSAASEMGIAPDLVAQAASEIETKSRGFWPTILGGPVSMKITKSIAGELSPDRHPALLTEIRKLTGRVGNPSSVGNSFEWISHQPDDTFVAVTPNRGSTYLDVRASIAEWIGLMWLAPVALSVVFGLIPAAEMHSTVGLLVYLFTMAITVAAARLVFGRFSRRRQASLNRLASEIEAFIERESVNASGVESTLPNIVQPEFLNQQSI